MTDAMLPPEKIRDDYNRTVRDLQGEYVQYRWLSSPTKRRHYRQTRMTLAWAARFAKQGRLLEVGCGPAVWTSLFLPAATSATLLDISDEMLAGARTALGNRPDVSFIRADFTEAELEPGTYDTVVSIRAFEYMPDKPATLSRFASVLRPGGTLILATKNAGWRDHREAQESVRERPAEEVPREARLQAGVIGWKTLEQLAMAAGLSDVKIHPVVFGSYAGWAQTAPALAVFDLVHWMNHRRAMASSFDQWTESVVLVATRQ
jgi:SAM-dependent methyltransferase